MTFAAQLSVAQTVGYFSGKVLGIPLVAQLERARVPGVLMLSALASTLAWAAFANLEHGPLSLLAIGCSCAPLALMWALTYRFVEGRRASDAVGAFLGCAIILGAGVGKCGGSYLLSYGVSAWTVPLLAALVATPAFGLFITLLSRTPPPTPEERVELGERRPLGMAHQRALLRRHWPGLAFLCVHYFLVSALRDGTRQRCQPTAPTRVAIAGQFASLTRDC